MPPTIPEGDFGPWSIRRLPNPRGVEGYRIGWDSYTVLARPTMQTLHTELSEIVMDDSIRELRRHMPILQAATGSVLITGLGLGCVVRGLLAKPEVTRIDVVEKCAHIVHTIGPDLERDPRVTITCADAGTFDPGGRSWDYAWHDIWSDPDAGEPHLDVLHGELMVCFIGQVSHQGAWMLDRAFKRRLSACGFPLLG